MKRLLTVLLCTMLFLSACGTAESTSETAPENPPVESSAESVPETQAETEFQLPEKQPSEFDEYSSNTVIATGANYATNASKGATYRTYLPIEQAGELEYCFYFSDVVDSTWERGRLTHAGMNGSDYEIISAHVTTAPDSETDLTDWTEITFDGNSGKSVTAGESFWSDSVKLVIPEGNYLVWEWTVQGELIPCTKMTELAYSYIVKENEPIYNMEIPLPKLIGAKRDVKKNLVCFGDSITQGAQTTAYANNFWVSEISESLGNEYAVWNAGLGYARASDAVISEDWLKRAKSGDIVTLAFGTNDLVAGQYNDGKPSATSTPEEIEAWIRSLITELQSAGCQVILFNAPPFDYDETHEAVRTALNERFPVIAEEMHVPLFDWSALLSDPSEPAKTLYGGHPNDEGCQMIAETFLEQFGDLLR
ncbi:MAG TPA: SGNH/GDSL hydrolase family protein [Ruminococcus sp.]|nr:SGNH/GDSL hydrolase family protein [Ruminococcus sp.]